MKKIRASYSFLNLWQQGKIYEALLSYFHVPHPTPESYKNGRIWDAYCQAYITKYNRLPEEWGGDKLKKPIVQMRLTASYNEICDLVGVLDVYDNKTIIELKSGHSASARQYANTMQIPIYLLLAQLSDIPVRQINIIRYNPKADKLDKALIYPSIRVINKATNFLDSLVPEVFTFFEQNDLFNPITIEKHIKKLEDGKWSL